MTQNWGAPVSGAVEPARLRSVGALAIAAQLLVGLVALVDVMETIVETREQAARTALLVTAYGITLAVAAVVFVVWLWQVRANAELVAGRRSQRLGRFWGIGGWICPVVGLWFPYQFVVDVWRASAPDREDSGDGIVLAWWLCFLATIIIVQVDAPDSDHSLAIVHCAVNVAAAGLAVLVIRRITEWQSRISS